MAMSASSATNIGLVASSGRDYLSPSPAMVWSCLSPATCPFSDKAGPTYMEMYERKLKRRRRAADEKRNKMNKSTKQKEMASVGVSEHAAVSSESVHGKFNGLSK